VGGNSSTVLHRIRHAMAVSVITAFAIGGANAAPYCDPRADLNCYKRWCASQGGTFTTSAAYGGVGCKPGSSGGGSSGGGGGFGGGQEAMMMDLAGKMMSTFLDGLLQSSAETKRQQQTQEEQRAAEFQRQWDEQQRQRVIKEEEQRQRLEEARQRVLDRIGGSGSSMRDPLTDPSLESRLDEKPGALGTREIKPRDPGLAAVSAPLQPRMLGKRTMLSAGERMSCSAALLKRANELAKSENFSEAAFLSNEASSVMQGANPGVECPNSSARAAPGDIKAVQLSSTLAVSEMLQKRTLAYSKLFSRVNQQAADYRSAESSVREAESQLVETRTQKEQASQHVRELETIHKQQPEKADPSAMAEAQAALRKAENAEQELAKVVATRQGALDGLKQQIDKTQQMTKNIDKKPDALDDILKDLDGQGAGR